MSGARIREVPLNQRIKPEAFVQLAREEEPSIGGDRGSAEPDAQLRVEREANRARFRVTHWMMPSASARHPRIPHFLRSLSDYGPAPSPLKTKIRIYPFLLTWLQRLPASGRPATRAAWYALHFALDFARRDPSRSHKSNENQLRNSCLRERNRRGTA